MMTHTPAPWTIVEYGDGDSLAIHAADSANRVCFMATHGGSQKTWETIQANAVLIAVTPDMFDVLRDIIAVMDNEERTPEEALLLERAKNIVAAATKER